MTTGLAPDDQQALRQPGFVAGQVTDPDGVLITEAVVECLGADGRPPDRDEDMLLFAFQFEGTFECEFRPGPATISARAPGCAARSIEVAVASDDHLELDTVLERAP